MDGGFVHDGERGGEGIGNGGSRRHDADAAVVRRGSAGARVEEVGELAGLVHYGTVAA